MKSCKDCVHYAVCYELTYHEPNGEIAGNKSCKNFKDKSKFIEIPFNIGDTVYVIPSIDGIKPIRKSIIECEISNIIFNQDGKTVGYSCEERYSGYFYYSCIFLFNSIGKTVFFTREEAEEALKNGVKINAKHNDKH